SPAPPDGALTSQSLSFGSKVVEAEVAPGVRTMTPLGTATWYGVPAAVKSIEPLSTCTVTGAALGSPLAVKAPLNQTVAPAGMAVPLKFAVMEETVDGAKRSSRMSRSGRHVAGPGRRRRGSRSLRDIG